MENLVPLTFNLEECLSLEEDYINILDNTYQALFHDSEAIRLKAKKTLVDIFDKEEFQITHIYASFHDVFLRANYKGDAVVFYVGCKPKNYHGKPTFTKNIYKETVKK